MRLWIVNQYARTPDQPGGTRHFGLARELAAKGHEITIVASSFNHMTRQGPDPQAPPGDHRETISDVHFRWLRTPSYRDNGFARIRGMLEFSVRVWTSLRREARPQVVLGSSPHLFGALAAERLARRFEVPFILEVRDLWPQSLVDLELAREGSPSVRVLERLEAYLYGRADRIIALMPGGPSHIEQKGVPANKISWLPNGIDLDLVGPADPAPAASDPFTIMYAGAHGLVNGLDFLLDAALLLQEEGWQNRVIFHLVGDGPAKPGLQRRVEKENIRIVRFAPPVPKREIYPLLQQADAHIALVKDSPIWKWGISLNKLYDYFACARPVLFGINSLNNPVAEAHAGLTFSPEDPRNLAEAVKRLLVTPPSERMEMGRNARSYVEQHHSFSCLADRLESLLVETAAPAVQP